MATPTASPSFGRRHTFDAVPPPESTRNIEGIVQSQKSTSVAQRNGNEESWVEISSQPSSSSLSSIGDDIITTGLRVERIQQNRPPHRRRHTQVGGSRTSALQRNTSTSSQEEYDESESDEEDHVMTSSNEHIPSLLRVPSTVKKIDNLDHQSDDDGENGTALGRIVDDVQPAHTPVFTPQPNAFSHPPSSQTNHRREATGTYFPTTPSFNHRHSYPNRRTHHSPYNAVSPNHRVDHDEALRASLTTLLSCAAAARGLPKRGQHGMQGGSGTTRPEFTGFRVIPESEVFNISPAIQRPSSPITQAPRSSSPSSLDAEKGKRKALVTSKPASQSRSAKKKKLVMDETTITPTLMTWVVSAGVVVLVSVVGFGAGYVIGREVGRQETLNGIAETASCGKVLRSTGDLRKLRWGNARGIVA